MRPFVRTDLDAQRPDRQRVKRDAIAAIGWASKSPHQVSRLEMIDGGSQLLALGIVKSYIEVGIICISCIEALEHIALHDKLTALPLKPDFLNDDGRGVDALKLYGSHVRRGTKRYRTTSKQDRQSGDHDELCVRIGHGWIGLGALFGCGPARDFVAQQFAKPLARIGNARLHGLRGGSQDLRRLVLGFFLQAKEDQR